MNRPFRAVNPDFPPNKSVIDAMKSPVIKNMTAYRNSDCSEIADKLFDAAGGKGGLLRLGRSGPAV
jgi:filamentous hemagglutinin